MGISSNYLFKKRIIRFNATVRTIEIKMEETKGIMQVKLLDWKRISPGN